MTRKAYVTIIALILAGIFITLGVFAMQTNITGRRLKAVMIVKSMEPGFEFWELVKKGAQEGAKEFNVDLTITGAMSESDIDGQIGIVKEAMAEKPDVLILAAADRDALLPYARQIKEAGIHLVIVDSGVSEHVEDCFVGTDNIKAANEVGEAMARSLDKTGDIVIISHQMQSSTAVDRMAGFEKAIAKYPDIQILGRYDIGGSVEKSRETMLELLEQNPELKGVFATNQISAEGVTAALRETGRDDVRFFAFDTSTTQNEALEQGIVDGFAVQMAFNMGYMSVKAAAEASTGALRTSNIDTGFAFATKENMKQEEIQKLIYPFV